MALGDIVLYLDRPVERVVRVVDYVAIAVGTGSQVAGCVVNVAVAVGERIGARCQEQRFEARSHLIGSYFLHDLHWSINQPDEITIRQLQPSSSDVPLSHFCAHLYKQLPVLFSSSKVQIEFSGPL